MPQNLVPLGCWVLIASKDSGATKNLTAFLGFKIIKLIFSNILATVADHNDFFKLAN